MPNDLSSLVRSLNIESTILFFGAGSSLPSHAPSVSKIIEHLTKVSGEGKGGGFTLSELADLIEQKTKDRKTMIQGLRTLFNNLKPTGGLLNIPLYEWKSIFTTNYDELIEESYKKQEKSLRVYSSNFDFTLRGKSESARLFKLHGTITKDVTDGNNSRIIISGNDYSLAKEYREHLFNTFSAELAESNLIIIGYSLADPDIKEIIDQALAYNKQSYAGSRITLLMYSEDPDRALLYEAKGLQVVFGSIDEFFAELSRITPKNSCVAANSDNPLDAHPSLSAPTLDAVYEAMQGTPNVSRMFNGWSASYADIAAGLTFQRSIADEISSTMCQPTMLCAVITGASGVGKTTAVRQIIQELTRGGHYCWEHKIDQELLVDEWFSLAQDLDSKQKTGVLFIDDAHVHLFEINTLIDALAQASLGSLKIIAASGGNNWKPRAKSPNLFKYGKEFHLSKLDSEEIGRLLTLSENNEAIRRLVENTFAGFSLQEKRRRLVDRCEADMFVCMRNIFSSEAFDDIILREYAELPDNSREVYRYIAALETVGVRVHRQLVIRLLGIPAASISAILDTLTDIVTEYPISEKQHIYGWKGRHPVINEIVKKYKFNNIGDMIKLFDHVIDNILPTYDIEIRSIRELCNMSSGLSRIPDKKIQNRLLRKMISVAPGERVPRHRLIRNLIDINEFDQAQTEIHIFNKDFGSDSPVERYKISLMVARAVSTPGIMRDDRVTILEQAEAIAVSSIQKFSYSPKVFAAYCDVGIEIYRLTGDISVFDKAMAELKEAETRIGDPQVSQMIRRYERKITGQSFDELSLDIASDDSTKVA